MDNRNDIVTFTSQTLEENINVLGRISLNLFVSSDQPDGDIVVKLVDKYPDGRNMIITDGIKRMRFRNHSYVEADEVFMTPGEVVQVNVDLPFTSYTFLPGHQIKIYVSGNSGIRWNVNRQDGGTMYVEGDTNIANIAIHHNSGYPSRIVLPGNNPTLGENAPTLELEKIAISLWPNPAADLVSIHYDKKPKSIKILELNGKLVSIPELIDSTFSVETLETGVYLVVIEMENGIRKNFKILKK